SVGERGACLVGCRVDNGGNHAQHKAVIIGDVVIGRRDVAEGEDGVAGPRGGKNDGGDGGGGNIAIDGCGQQSAVPELSQNLIGIESQSCGQDIDNLEVFGYPFGQSDQDIVSNGFTNKHVRPRR